MLAACLATASAQAVFIANGRAVEKPTASFTLPTQTNDVKDAVTEFRRFVENEAWEKAFQSLTTITAKAANGFTERPDGVLVPGRLLVRSLLASMPPAGKSAYRVFYDADAQALWQKATGAAELENLTKIVDNHLISSVGDQAADRLGDLYFERGEFDQAVVSWRAVLDYCPDSRLSKALLLTKVASAQAMAGRTGDLAETRRSIAERYAAEEVVIGGRATAAGEELARLAASAPERTAVTTEAGDDLTLPGSDGPLWEFRFETKASATNPQQPFPIPDVYGRMRPNDFPIPAATDGERLFVNVFGVEMAFDLASGKMLWRTGRMHELEFQQNRRGVMPERYAIAVSNGRTWSVTRNPQQLNQYPPVFSLVVRDAATGKEVFNTRTTLSAWSIAGAPYVVNGAAIQASAPSAPAAAGSASLAGLDFSQGFGAANNQLTLNGNAAVVENRVRLTDGSAKQASSVYSTKPVNIDAFETEFEFQLTKAFADGIMFVLQGDGPNAIGDWSNGSNGIMFEGINKSVGVKFDIYGPDANSTGICLDGVRPTADTAVSLKGTKIDLKSGHPFKVVMKYDRQNLSVTLTDTQTSATHTATYPVDIASHVGGSQAHVGFTGSSGLLTAVQEVRNWKFQPVPSRAAPAPPPTPITSTVYLSANRVSQGREVSVLLLDANTGKLIKSLSIGSHTVDQNQVYNDRPCESTFLLLRGRLYLDTHAGAMVALRPDTSAVEWGMLYESPPQQTGYYYEYQPPQLGVSGPLAAGGLLFVKGMRSPRLLALRVDGPELAWSRPVSTGAVLAGADEEFLYLGGDEVAAYRLANQELVWATQLPRSAAWSVPVLTKSHLYQFTSRGIYELDKVTGAVTKLFRGSDLDALGGSLLVTPKALITVSNLRITAYPRAAAADKAGQSEVSAISSP